jgi:hypothetical protein
VQARVHIKVRVCIYIKKETNIAYICKCMAFQERSRNFQNLICIKGIWFRFLCIANETLKENLFIFSSMGRNNFDTAYLKFLTH